MLIALHYNEIFFIRYTLLLLLLLIIAQRNSINITYTDAYLQILIVITFSCTYTKV